MSQHLRDISISGFGNSSGGTFQRVRIDGMGEINGDVACASFVSNGKGKITGSIQADKFEVRGMCTVKGSMQADHSRIDGTISIGGRLTGETIEINGTASVAFDCEAERFKSHGSFDIGGLLNAGAIDIKLLHSCRAREIGGEHISVMQGKPLSVFSKLFSTLFSSPHLETDTIEGDKVVLEYTKARVVRGTQVIIGPGCEIDLVEYKQSVQLHESARVNNHIRI
ncbi:polymer-forming cytoskeletal protein [Paenibacillus apiarius]|uniref:Polymer-forming cytoskeletal protein n=1 Tax=Paenibacillus apiarius TaxID=46240 RepID=A0ABT4DSD5_9BACL|nr:polymer-forming cytoskeletal protein [Paenibacillus apiarius]MCY9512843.1 polymer-forming cytoskeletal protein [Paenibacillus apiarius]MCY9519013.1 polymer-forming cytoskeletal protein [Paenibacillus apiarius]MCY9550822.1 polymer-forming cytoskeletal protein [Paenibacillus apiarius]MCY9559744.1 polymer-forming cytoskeletal protein [Paenibacillus apiarius]MCY9681987.1 polymer-forming cytoskeletal protein [Paenibacillus apiarius]